MSDEPGSDPRVALVRRAQAGEAAAFAELARGSARAVHAIALAHLGRIADAEDVAQSVLLAAFEQLDRCRDPHRFDAWLLAIARNRSRRALLRRRLRDVLARPPAEVGATAAPFDAADRELLLRALAGLPVRQREIVLLHDLEELTHAEIARALSISEEASRQHLSRARKHLRLRLEGGSP